jgi:hypothetical protein
MLVVLESVWSAPPVELVVACTDGPVRVTAPATQPASRPAMILDFDMRPPEI